MIKQIHHDGRIKIWKKNQEAGILYMGTSRKAHLISIDTLDAEFELVFKYQHNAWKKISFNQDLTPASVIIKDGDKIELPHSTIYLNLFERNSFLIEQISHQNCTTGAPASLLVLTIYQNRIISTRLLNKSKIFILNSQVSNSSTSSLLDFNKTDMYQVDQLTYKLANVLEHDSHVLMKQSHKLSQTSVKENKETIALFVTTFLLIGLSLAISQKNQRPLEVPLPSQLKVTQSIIKNKLKKTSEKQPPSRQKSTLSPPAETSVTSGGQKTGLLKAALGARISQLLSKVSATEARNQNIILVKQGLKANEGPTGRALAAIGQVNASGRNWTGDSTAVGLIIGTSGKGGGHGTGTLSSALGQGKTGQGGVGLIEDESEIIGGLDREIIAQYIKTQLGQILYCYERQLSASPDLYGKIAVKFTIAGSGTVETQSINDTTLKNRSVENCILSKVAKWKFPEPRGGTKVLVTYPFLFKSTN